MQPTVAQLVTQFSFLFHSKEKKKNRFHLTLVFFCLILMYQLLFFSNKARINLECCIKFMMAVLFIYFFLRAPLSAENREASLSSSSLSVRDLLRQRFSVTWHPRLLYLIVSDGYMATVLKVQDRQSPALVLKALLKDTSEDLEKISRKLEKSQVVRRRFPVAGMFFINS